MNELPFLDDFLKVSKNISKIQDFENTVRKVMKFEISYADHQNLLISKIEA